MPPQTIRSIVYFLRAGKRGPVKVGTTLGSSAKYRMAELQTGNAETLYLLGVVPGGVELEREIHARLADHRMRGEWFKPTAEVMEVLKEYASFAPTEHPRDRSVARPRGHYYCENCDHVLGPTRLPRPRSMMCRACEEFAAFRASGEEF